MYYNCNGYMYDLKIFNFYWWILIICKVCVYYYLWIKSVYIFIILNICFIKGLMIIVYLSIFKWVCEE